WIVMKALEKDRNRRYETANGLALDILRYLADEPVLACPPSAGYRARKFARRHKSALAGTGLVLACVAVICGSLGWFARERATRRAKAGGAFEESVQQARAFMKSEDWPEARAAAQRAAGLLAGAGGDESLQHRLDQLETDLNMAATLELARLEQTEVRGGRFDNARAAPAYADAFRTYGLPVLDLE